MFLTRRTPTRRYPYDDEGRPYIVLVRLLGIERDGVAARTPSGYKCRGMVYLTNVMAAWQARVRIGDGPVRWVGLRNSPPPVV